VFQQVAHVFQQNARVFQQVAHVFQQNARVFQQNAVARPYNSGSCRGNPMGLPVFFNPFATESNRESGYRADRGGDARRATIPILRYYHS